MKFKDLQGLLCSNGHILREAKKNNFLTGLTIRNIIHDNTLSYDLDFKLPVWQVTVDSVPLLDSHTPDG